MSELEGNNAEPKPVKEEYTEEYGVRSAKEQPGANLVVFRAGLWKSVTKKGVPCLRGGLKNYWINMVKHTPSPEGGRHTAVMILSPKKEIDPSGIVVDGKTRESAYFILLYTSTSKKFGDFWNGKYGGYAWQIWPAKKYSPKSPDFSLVVRTLQPKEEWHNRDSNAVRNVEGQPTFEMLPTSNQQRELEPGEYLEEPVESDPWDDDNEPF